MNVDPARGSSGIPDIARRSAARTRSLSAENPTSGWPLSTARRAASASIEVAAGGTAVLADVAGPGVIRHLWMTSAHHAWRTILLCITSDGHARTP